MKMRRPPRGRFNCTCNTVTLIPAFCSKCLNSHCLASARALLRIHRRLSRESFCTLRARKLVSNINGEHKMWILFFAPNRVAPGFGAHISQLLARVSRPFHALFCKGESPGDIPLPTTRACLANSCTISPARLESATIWTNTVARTPPRKVWTRRPATSSPVVPHPTFPPPVSTNNTTTPPYFPMLQPKYGVRPGPPLDTLPQNLQCPKVWFSARFVSDPVWT